MITWSNLCRAETGFGALNWNGNEPPEIIHVVREVIYENREMC